MIKATAPEIISAHVQHARNIGKKQKSILLSDAWSAYSIHPERATPATMSEALAYQSTFQEFINFVDDPKAELGDITPKTAEDFAQYLRKTEISVSTHNRKLKRISRVFRTLREYIGEIRSALPRSIARNVRSRSRMSEGYRSRGSRSRSCWKCCSIQNTR
jgi:site-specific recombinase XerD